LHPRSNIDRDWSPFTIGTFDDLKEAAMSVQEGMRMRFYDLDRDERGDPDDLLFDGVAHYVSGRGWGAIIDASTFHWESDERKAPNNTP
jgi:hypothetical protein